VRGNVEEESLDPRTPSADSKGQTPWPLRTPTWMRLLTEQASLMTRSRARQTLGLDSQIEQPWYVVALPCG